MYMYSNDPPVWNPWQLKKRNNNAPEDEYLLGFESKLFFQY